MERQLNFKSGSQGSKKAASKRFRASLDPDQTGKLRKRIHLREISDEAPKEVETVGGELRAARLRAGKSVREVAEALRFRVRQLEALEQGDHKSLPGTTYAVGFVRAYAEHLGLNPEEFVRRFKAELQGAQAGEKLDFPTPKEETRVPTGLLVAVIFIIVILVGFVLYFTTGTSTDENVPPVPDYMLEDVLRGRTNLTGEPGETPAPPQVQPSAPPKVETKPLEIQPGGSTEPAPQVRTGTAPAAPNTTTPGSAFPGLDAVDQGAAVPNTQVSPDSTQAAPARPVVRTAPVYRGPKFAIRAQANAWLRVDSQTGAVLIQRVLESGEVFALPDKGTVKLTVRNAGAFEILVNGRSVGRAGLVGQHIIGEQLDVEKLLDASR